MGLKHAGVVGKLFGADKGWEKHDKMAAEGAHERAKRGKKQKTFFSDTGKSHGKGRRVADDARNRKKWKKHIRTKKQIGGRANLLEEMGRIDAERMNPNRSAEKHRVIGELNRGYNKGGKVSRLDNMTINKKGQPLATRVKMKKGGDGKWIQKVNASIKRRGTKGKCTPITKPGCTGRAKALAKTFKKMAKARKK